MGVRGIVPVASGPRCRRQARRRAAGLVLACVAGVTAGGCARESDDPGLSLPAVPEPPDDPGEMVEDAIAAMQDIKSADVTMTFTLGPEGIELDGEWDEHGTGQVTVGVDRGNGVTTLELRSDGDMAWLHTDDPAVAGLLPPGVSWVEAPRRELLDAGVLQDLDAAWDWLLFLRGMESVEDRGVETVGGAPVRVLHGTVDDELAHDRASPDEAAAMDEAFSFSMGVNHFDADVGIDAQGRVRTLDYDIGIGPQGAAVSLPVTFSFRVTSFDQAVEVPDAPDPDVTVSSDEVPGVLDALQQSTGGGSASRPPTGPSPEPGPGALDREPPDPAPPPADTPTDALEVTTLIEGRGEPAVPGDTLVVHYVGVTADGTVFDSSWEAGEPIVVSPLGDANMISGWEQGLVGVRIGERRRLVIGSGLAYGPAGAGDGLIPPNAPLAFEIDVVDVVPA